MTFTVVGAYPTGQTWVEHAEAGCASLAGTIARDSMADRAGYTSRDCPIIAIFEGRLMDLQSTPVALPPSTIAQIREAQKAEFLPYEPIGSEPIKAPREIMAATIMSGFCSAPSDDPLMRLGEPEVLVNHAVELTDMLLRRLSEG